jgi:hypothetical protein
VGAALDVVSGVTVCPFIAAAAESPALGLIPWGIGTCGVIEEFALQEKGDHSLAEAKAHLLEIDRGDVNESVLVEYDDPPLNQDQLRIRNEFSSPKHGTEPGLYRGTSALARLRYDSDANLFVPTLPGGNVAAYPRGRGGARWIGLRR